MKYSNRIPAHYGLAPFWKELFAASSRFTQVCPKEARLS